MANKDPVALTDLKTLLDLTGEQSDPILTLIIKNTVQTLSFRLGLKEADEFPMELSYIPLEVCVRRFNRRKNEGMAAYSQEGESITFNPDDFADFANDIADWKDANQKKIRSHGRLSFISGYGGNSADENGH